jgi:hypothetical protein
MCSKHVSIVIKEIILDGGEGESKSSHSNGHSAFHSSCELDWIYISQFFSPFDEHQVDLPFEYVLSPIVQSHNH